MDQRKIKIYTTEDVPRLRYITGIILGDILGLSWEITTDKRKLGKYNVINYSGDDISGSFKISPDSLLFEKGIKPRELIIDNWGEIPVIFPSPNGSDLPFDLFAASFFLVSRYEEYLEFQPDDHGRFRAHSSIAFKNGFLYMPVVDIWAREFALALLKKFHNMAFKRNRYDALVTIDMDQPFAYLGKGFIRSVGGMFRDIKNRSEAVNERYKIVTGREKDPYDTFDYIIESIGNEGSESRFFIPVGNHSEFDKHPSWKNDEYRRVIREIGIKFITGLHPSYFAASNPALVIEENDRLNKILDREIKISRFHFIRLLMPDSYHNIIAAGIFEDYSMGYPDEPGFRAGIARPYNFYDIVEEKETMLKIIPFQVMDMTLYSYKKLDPAASKEVILRLIDETRKVGGLFVSIWHNTSLLDNTDWHEWRKLFEYMLHYQKP